MTDFTLSDESIATLIQIAKDNGLASIDEAVHFLVVNQRGIDTESWNDHAPRADGRFEG